MEIDESRKRILLNIVDVWLWTTIHSLSIFKRRCIVKEGNIRYLTTNIVSQMYNKTFPLLTINPNLYFFVLFLKLLFTQFNPNVMCARCNVFHHAIKCTLRYHNNYNYRCCYYTLLLNLDTFVLWARHCYRTYVYLQK